ncbi:MAG: hypothetical protein LPD71_00095 [Shewanella sp.]|nr:hypothetical protein [Shewanella sp.]MCF1437202.1 hypothetical protein [Shewanella sp.]MCF1459484.1 hypothetical protein [Shewanella sp.]
MKYQPIFFKVCELVPIHVYDKYGKNNAMRLIDDRVLMTLDQLRHYFGACIINNWHSGGQYYECGFRDTDCEHYSQTSQHSFGRAMDCKFCDVQAEEVRQVVIKKRQLFPWISFLEDEVDWFHFDVRNEYPIQLWSPSKNTIVQL